MVSWIWGSSARKYYYFLKLMDGSTTGGQDSASENWQRYVGQIYLLYLNMFAKLHSRVQEQPCTFAASMFWYALTWTSRQVTATRWQCTPHNCCGNSSHLTSNHVQGYLYTTTKMPRHAKNTKWKRTSVVSPFVLHALSISWK
jgi:hypothetical protein